MNNNPRQAIRRWIDPLYRALETKAHFLRYLFIEITQRCNLDCLHCGSDCGRDPKLNELSADEWLCFLGYLPKHFNRENLFLVLTGGEPFCSPNLDTVLGGLKQNRLEWGMVTNGWALTRSNMEKVVAHGISSMTVSIDGLASSHDWLRNRKGSFQRAIEGIQHAIKAGLPFFDVVTCVHPGNLEELPQILDLLNSIGVRDWRLFSIFPKGRAAQDARLRLDDIHLRRLLEWITNTRAKLRGCDFRLQYCCEGFLPPHVDRAVREEPYFCRAGINIASVLCDGSIGACPNIVRSLTQGNVRTDDFASVWENQFSPYRNRSWMQTGECVGCLHWKRCQGNSLHLWDENTRHTAWCHFRALATKS